MSGLIREIRKVIRTHRARLIETYAKELQIYEEGIVQLPKGATFLFNSYVSKEVPPSYLTDVILLAKIEEFKDGIFDKYNVRPTINIACVDHNIELSANVVNIMSIERVEVGVQDELLEYLKGVGYTPSIELVNSLLDYTIDETTFKRLAKTDSNGDLCL
jgi:hypothetical protein